MARNTSDERQSEKLAKLDALKAQIAKMEGNATKRFGTARYPSRSCGIKPKRCRSIAGVISYRGPIS